MRYQPQPFEFHSANRRKLAEAIGPAAIAIIDTADVLSRPGDFEHSFRPDSNFYYLTGIDEPNAVLVLAPGHPDEALREILFLRETNDFIALWAGRRLNREEGTRRSGIATVHWLNELEQMLGQLVATVHAIYLNADFTLDDGPLDPSQRRAAALRTQLPLHELHSAAPILGEFRTVKTPAEVGQIRRAIAITGQGLAKAWATMQPGLPEYALEAELTAEFTRQGATGSAFSAIIAAGTNATVIHYGAGDAVITDDDLILFDVGAEAGYYAADISRTVPASGLFSQRQRAIYEAVHKAQQVGIRLHKPGATILSIDAQMRKVLIGELVKIDLMSARQASSAEAEQHLHEYYPHISHHLGLDVHDTGRADLPLKPGMVVTCEPGLYIPQEGIGVRLEDVVLITKSGYEVLSAGIPSDPDAIEAAIARAKA